MSTETPVAHSEARVPFEADKGRLWLLVCLSTLMGLASIATDLYLPAFPVIAHALRADAGAMEWTVSAYLIGFCAGQLLWGPISDRIGRRAPLTVGAALFVLGSAGCALSESAAQMIAWRVVQAAGASAAFVVARAMVRDLYAGARAAQMLSTLIAVMAIGPLIGPTAGGQILALSSWRTIFWTLVGFGALALAAVKSLPETLAPAARNREGLHRALSGYAYLMRQRRILSHAGALAFFHSGMFAYIAGSPDAYIGYYHVPPQLYGLLFGLVVLGLMAANLLNARIVVRFGGARLLRLGAIGAAIAGFIVAVSASTGWGGLFGLVVPLFCYAAMTGFINANSMAGAMEHFPERAGAVSALVGAMQFGAGVISSGLVGALADGTPAPMGWVIAAAGLGAALCALALPRHAQRTGAPTS